MNITANRRTAAQHMLSARIMRARWLDAALRIRHAANAATAHRLSVLILADDIIRLTAMMDGMCR